MLKRILAMVLVLCMFLTVSVSAAGELDFMKETMRSYESSHEISFTVNKPISFLNTLLEMLTGSEGVSMVTDLDKMVESIFEGTTRLKIRANVSKDYKKMALGLEVDEETPFYFNRNLNLNIASASGLWLELDITDKQNPVYEMIIRNPFMDKYMVYDMIALMKESGSDDDIEEMLGVFEVLQNETVMKAITDKGISLLYDCAKISRSGSTVTVKMDDLAAKKYIIGVIDVAAELISSAIVPARGVVGTELTGMVITDDSLGSEEITVPAEIVTEAEKELYLPEATPAGTDITGIFDMIKAAINSVRIFGDDGIVIKYKLSGRKLSAAEADVHIALDFKEIAAASGAGEEIVSKLDGAVLDFVIHEKDIYRNVNQNVRVNKPELTAENSVNLLDMIMRTEEIYEYEPEPFARPSIYVWEEEYINRGSAMYLGVRNLFESMYGVEFDIAYDKGVITVTEESGVYGFKNMIMKVGEKTVTVDGKVRNITNPIIQIGGKTYADTMFVSSILGYELLSASHDLINNSINYDFWKMPEVVEN